MTDKAKELLKTNAQGLKDLLNDSAFRNMVSTEPWSFDSFIKLHTTPPVRFKDFHGNEVRDGEWYWVVEKINFNPYKGVCYSSSETTEGMYYFSTEQAAKDWIELNKPCLSVHEVLEWLMDENENPKRREIFTKELLEIIRKKS